MESVVPKERYIDCPYCHYPISSYEPVCKKCGLEVNRAGIEELARIEEQISLALDGAGNLKILASIPFVFSFINLYYFWLDPQAVWLNVPFYASCGYFIVSFIKWHWKYSGIIFDPDDLEKIRNDKRVAVTLIAYSMIVGFGLTLFR